MLLSDLDDAVFDDPEIVAITTSPNKILITPPSVRTDHSSAPSPFSTRSPRVSLGAQLSSMLPTSLASSSSSSSPSFSSPSSTSAARATHSTSASSLPSASVTSPYFRRVPPSPAGFAPSHMAVDDDAPTLASLFGQSPRGMTAVLDLSPSKKPPSSAATSSSSSLVLPPYAPPTRPIAPSKPIAPARPPPQSSPAFIDLADDDSGAVEVNDNVAFPLPAAAAAPLPSLAEAERYSQQQLASLNEPRTKPKRYRGPKNSVLLVHIQLISPTLIGVSSVPKDDRVASIVQAVSGAVYDEKLGQWTCRVSALSAVQARLQSLRGEHLEVEIDAPDSRLLPRNPDEREEHRSGEADKEQAADVHYEWMKRIPRKLARQLYPFQREGVDFVLSRGGRALIGDEMGLGKTLQSIAVCAYYSSAWPVLIVCPSSLRLNWRNEIERWLPEVGHRQIQVIMSGKDRLFHRTLHSSTRFTIISYDLITKFEVSLKKADFSIIIADESHYLKSDKAKRTKALVPLLRKAQHCILLSGTPALSRPMELYTQVSALQPDMFGTLHEFGTRYCDAKRGRWGWEYRGARNLAELNFLLKQRVMVRRLKDEVLTQLAPKSRTAVMVTVDDPEVERVCKRLTELRAMAEKLVANTSNSTAGIFSGFSAETRATLFEMFKKTGEAKLSAVLQYLSDMLQNGVKFLVFAHHHTVLDGIEQFLVKEGAQYFRLDGHTLPADRQAGVDRFQNDSRCRVALLSITAGGTGITLTASSTVVFAELQFTPALLLQAEDRVHRIGQPNAVNIHYLLGRHSLDDLLWPMLVKKMAVVGSTLDGEEQDLLVEDIKGEAGDRAFKKGNAMEQWLEKEALRKAAKAEKEAAMEARRREKWKDAIELDSGDDEQFDAFAPSTRPSPSPEPDAFDEDEEPRDSMWVYLSDDNDPDEGFIVDDDEDADGDAATGDGDGEDEEEENDDGDEFDHKYSDSDFEPDSAAAHTDADDEDEGEAEYGVSQPVHKKSRRNIIRSDDDEEEVKDAGDRRAKPSTGRLTPVVPRSSITPSSTSPASTSSTSPSPWSSVFGVNPRVEKETAQQRDHKLNHKLTAAQRTAQRRKEETKARNDDDEDVDEDDVIISSSVSSRANDDSGGGLMMEADLHVMLVGMDFEQRQVSKVLRDLAQGAQKGKEGAAMIDINRAIERLTAEVDDEKADGKHVHQEEDDEGDEAEMKYACNEPRVRPSSLTERKASEEDIPCERCGVAIPFFSYSQHVVDGDCRKKRAAPLADEEEGGADGEDEDEVEEMPLKRAVRRRSRLIDLEESEELEETIVTNEDNSVDDVSAVEWIPE